MKTLPETYIDQLVDLAISEDVNTGDVTATLLPVNTRVKANIMTREPMVLCGTAFADRVFKKIDGNTAAHWLYRDGQTIAANTIFCQLDGVAPALLTAERCALNFLQLLSGTATTTAQYVAKLPDAQMKLLDTRKTIPGFRLAQKYAVTCGGGCNHRAGLYDAYLIKENHIAACGSITQAIQQARSQENGLLVEVEVETLMQLQEAIAAKADRIMLDNFSLEQIRQAVAITAGRIPLEVSGNVSIDQLDQYRTVGVDYVSIGALTKHVRAVDLSMRIHNDG